MAVISISDGSNTVEITLIYHLIGDNTWKCEPGILPVSSGTWTSSAIGNRVILSDDAGQVLYLDHMNITVPVGYPFSGLGGSTGDGLTLRSGGLIDGPFEWTFVDDNEAAGR
jgi:hypothetical protein